MSRLLISGLPEPEPGTQWCGACAAEHKGALLAFESVAKRLEEIVTDGKSGVAVLAPPKDAHLPPLSPAVASAPCKQLGGAVVPLCWSHMTATVPPVEGNGRGHPGLIKGTR